jgi:hypothetical protein
MPIRRTVRASGTVIQPNGYWPLKPKRTWCNRRYSLCPHNYLAIHLPAPRRPAWKPNPFTSATLVLLHPVCSRMDGHLWPTLHIRTWVLLRHHPRRAHKRQLYSPSRYPRPHLAFHLALHHRRLATVGHKASCRQVLLAVRRRDFHLVGPQIFRPAFSRLGWVEMAE